VRDRGAPRANDVDDATLALELLAGRPGAALLAWERFSPTVQLTLLRMLGPGHDLEDLTQEVFLRFFDRLRDVRKHGSLRPFIIGISIRRAQEEIRRRQIRRRLAPFLPIFLRPTFTELDEQGRDALVHFYRLLDKLSVEDRTLYVLRYVDEMDHAQMSEVLVMSVATVRRRLDRLTTRMDALVQDDPVLADYVAGLHGEHDRGAAARAEPGVPK
jgi:RNA polymerase sigma factor (sigma-70 family)